jgi:YD repeat-containing protein
VQTRILTYSSVSRLVSAQKPETDNTTTTYTYDGNGNLTQKGTPNGNVTTYTYDAYNRVKITSYSGPLAAPSLTTC